LRLRRADVRRGARVALHAPAAAVTTAVYALGVAPVSRASAARRRRRGERPRIVWGPVPIANLQRHVLADRSAGYESETIVYRLYRESDRAVFDHVLDGGARLRGVGQLVPYWAFLRAGLRYDVFGFYFDGGLLGETPFWWLELPLLRLAGKKILAIPYGGDARLPSVTRAYGKWHAYTDVPPGAEDRDERAVRRRLRAFGRWANVILGCADLVADLPRVDGIFLYPFDEREWQPRPSPDDGVVRIVHAPNHPHYKGTRYLQDAVASLEREGLPVELVLVQGMDEAQARREYARADIVADQFLIGAYALFAIEGMALGKPVVCYLNDRFRPWHREWEEAPIVSASPDELEDALRRLVLDADLRRRLGEQGPQYVRRYHSLEAVGRRLDAVYRSLWDRAATDPSLSRTRPTA
jgi:glycosyltransferase involved in cell wall biosynthesis